MKNDHLGFTIPYTLSGQPKNYTPDFIVHIDDGHGPGDPLQLILEVSGAPNKKKEAKTSTAETMWIPAVNNAATWGRWDFIEIADPWDAASLIRSKLSKPSDPIHA